MTDADKTCDSRFLDLEHRVRELEQWQAAHAAWSSEISRSNDREWERQLRREADQWARIDATRTALWKLVAVLGVSGAFGGGAAAIVVKLLGG